jgi:hypothetical protein
MVAPVPSSSGQHPVRAPSHGYLEGRQDLLEIVGSLSEGVKLKTKDVSAGKVVSVPN